MIPNILTMHTVNIFQLAFGVWKSTLKVSGKTKKKNVCPDDSVSMQLG